MLQEPSILRTLRIDGFFHVHDKRGKKKLQNHIVREGKRNTDGAGQAVIQIYIL